MKVEENPLTGKEMCDTVSCCINETTDRANRIVNVLRLYESDKKEEAKSVAFAIFADMKEHLLNRYSGDFHRERYFRIRNYEETFF